MVVVFEGARNSGKTFLSREVSRLTGIPRFQFDFAGGFNLLGIENSNNREAHSFAMGKELMLLQLVRDMESMPTFIHDRGILTVLTWGLLENRIKESDVDDQIKYIQESELLNKVLLTYIFGENPDQSQRHKDQWDYADGSDREKKCLNLVIEKLEKAGVGIFKFENQFNEDSVKSLSSIFSQFFKKF